MTTPLNLRGSTAPGDFASGSVLFIGNATVLIRFAGFTLLTDPNFLHAGGRVHLGYGFHATRLKDPAMDLSEVPRFDLVVLSHLHEDHFDRDVARDLDRGTPIVTTPKAAEALAREGFRMTLPLSTWRTRLVQREGASLRITAMPGRHGPGPLNYVLPPVMGTMLEFSRDRGQVLRRMYITGDTILYPGLRVIREQYPEIDLALTHLGGTRIAGVTVTMTGEDGAELLRMIGPREAIPIHIDDYDRFKSPLEDFETAVRELGQSERVRYLKRGESYRFDVGEERAAPRASTTP